MKEMTYTITLRGHLPASWSDWFEGMELVQHDDGTTQLTGTALDQSALHGILRKIRDLGLTLISLEQLPSS